MKSVPFLWLIISHERAGIEGLIMRIPFLFLSLLPLGLSAQTPPAAPVVEKAATPQTTDADFAIQGEYTGEKNDKKMGVQIIALGKGEFEAVGYHGGLPGAGWDGKREDVSRSKGVRLNGESAVTFEHGGMIGKVDGKKILVSDTEGAALMELARVDRKSPTLGAQPPAGAVVLFGGKDANDFTGSSVTEDGLLTQGATSQKKFTDFKIHLEFQLPYMPEARGQGRGNSGLYLQGRYEVQMLDSFGLKGEDNECGGLYKIAAPKENLCLPPQAWQTYDVDFTAAKFSDDGKRTAKAKLTVRHNGVIIHDGQELPGVTGSSILKDESTAPGPIYLQNHGNPVRYRNIWVIPG